MISLSAITLKLVATTPPNATLVAPVNPLPVTVTDVPPAGGPDDGAIRAITGEPPAVELTTAVAAETAGVPGPLALLAVSCTRIVEPTSPAVRV